MLVKVVNRENQEVHEVYANVDSVTDVFDENGNYCKRVNIGDETATFPASEWKLYKLDWVSL